MSQLALFDVAPVRVENPYAFDPNAIGAAIQPFIRFCKERLGAREGDGTLSIIIEDAWKMGRTHPYLKAWDAFAQEQGGSDERDH